MATINESIQLLQFVNDNLKPKEKEKKKNGEVFTPIILIDEMLDKLDENYRKQHNSSIFADKSLKWYDPAVGIGNFAIIIYMRLLVGLGDSIPDEEERKTHIIENMLYMSELNPNNTLACKRVFCGDKYKLNLYEGDSLKLDVTKEWGIENFDVIIGNPPYNKNGIGKGGGAFWKQFVTMSLKILKNDGFLEFIHPTGWRKPTGKRQSAGDIFEEFKKYNLLFIKISDIKIINFPRVDYYVLQKSNKKTKTRIINEYAGEKTDEELSIYELPFIPHIINSNVISILNKLFNNNNEKLNIINDQSFKPKKEEKFNIIRDQSFQPKKEDMNKSGIPHTYYYDVLEKDYLLVYKNYLDKNIPEYISNEKIIMTYKTGKEKAKLYPKYFSTEIGSTSNTMYQIIRQDDNINNILKLLDSELINFILKITQYSEAPNYINEFKILNMISKPNEGTINNETDVYSYYDITEEEMNFIQKIIQKKL